MIFIDEVRSIAYCSSSVTYINGKRTGRVRAYRQCAYLLGRDIKGLSPHVNFLVNVHAWYDEEHAGAPGAPGQQTT